MKTTQDWPHAFNPDERYGGAMIGLTDDREMSHDREITHMVRTMLEQCEQTLNALGAPPDARDYVVITIRRVKWASAPNHCHVSWVYDRKKNAPHLMCAADTPRTVSTVTP